MKNENCLTFKNIIKMKNTLINDLNNTNDVLNFVDDNYYCGGCAMIGFVDDEYYNIFGWGKKAKAKKAERKLAKADKIEAKGGNPEKVARLRARAEQLKAKAMSGVITAAEKVELTLAEQGLDLGEGTVDKSGAVVVDEGTGTSTGMSKTTKILMWSGIGVGVLAVGFILYRVLRPKKA